MRHNVLQDKRQIGRDSKREEKGKSVGVERKMIHVEYADI